MIFQRFQHSLSLLALMAMGNWTNTPSPPNDPNAPPAVGNAGEVRLDVDGEDVAIQLQSAQISGRTLTLEGEDQNAEACTVLSFELPETAFPKEELDVKELRHSGLTLCSVCNSQIWIDRTGDLVAVTGGTLGIVQATGSGPWEFDGTIELTTQEGPAMGTFQARVNS